jgi:hypothetical protein
VVINPAPIHSDPLSFSSEQDSAHMTLESWFIAFTAPNYHAHAGLVLEKSNRSLDVPNMSDSSDLYEVQCGPRSIMPDL